MIPLTYLTYETAAFCTIGDVVEVVLGEHILGEDPDCSGCSPVQRFSINRNDVILHEEYGFSFVVFKLKLLLCYDFYNFLLILYTRSKYLQGVLFLAISSFYSETLEWEYGKRILNLGITYSLKTKPSDIKCVTDLEKFNFVKLDFGGSSQYLPGASKYIACFKSDQNRLKNNHLI